MAVNVRDDQFLIGDRIVGQQVGVTGVGIDDHFVDLLQAIRIALHQFVVLRAESPVQVANRKFCVGRQHAHFFVIDHFENSVEEV